MKRATFFTSSIVLAGVGLMLLSAPAFAEPTASTDTPTTQPSPQNAPGQRATPMNRLQSAISQLDLTPDQKTKVDAILASTRQQIQTLRPQLRNMTPEQRRAKITPILQGVRQQLSTVLTPEQMQSLRQNMQNGAGGQNGGGLVAALKQAVSTLNLSADQQKQVDDLLAQTQKDLADARASAQKDPSGAQEDLKQIRQDTVQQLQQILTPEQATQFEAEMKKFRAAHQPASTQPGNDTNTAPQT